MRDSYTYLIIGGGVAGVSAAETIRSRDREGTIGIVSGEPHRLYSRVLLPRYVRGDIPREKVFLRGEDDYERARIEILPNMHASFVNTAKKEVGLTDHSVLRYSKLLIASGGEPAPSNLDAYEDYVFRFQTLDQADRLRERFQKQSFKHPLVIGGSLIALEFLSLSAHYKIPARVLFRSTHFFSRLMGVQGGEFMKRILSSRGFSFVPTDEVIDAAEGDGFLRIETQKLATFDHDAVFIGLGLKRNVDFLAGSGVALGEAVKTNEYLETNVPGVYAAGDAAEFYDVLFGRHHIVGNWTNSFLHGKLAGLNMTGEHLALKVVSSYSTSHFGLHIAAMGDYVDVKDSFEHVDSQRNTYVRYCVKDDLLVGAVMVNLLPLRAHMARLIETQTPLGAYRARLKESSFDIREIPIVKSE